MVMKAQQQSEPPKVPNTQAVALRADVHPDATLPQAIQAAMSCARASRCSVGFDWPPVAEMSIRVVVTPEDTYQGVQTRVGKQLKGEE